jgi:hypothetical protein
MPKNVREVLHEGGNVAAAGQGKGRGARNKDGEGRGGSTRRARVPGEGRSAACRRRQKAKSIILYKPVVNCSMPHRSLNTARMEAEAEGAARAEREARRRPKRRPGRVYTREASSWQNSLEISPLQDRRSAPAGYRDRRRSRKSERASVKDFIMDEQLLSMDKVLHRCHPSHFAALLFFTFPSCTCVPLAATCVPLAATCQVAPNGSQSLPLGKRKWHAEPRSPHVPQLMSTSRNSGTSCGLTSL